MNALLHLDTGDRTTETGFDRSLASAGCGSLRRQRLTTIQLNVGKRCNMSCHHCHVDAGPKRTEVMSGRVAERVLELLAASPGVDTLDLTGGAPELNPHFRWLVTEARRLGKRVVDRCNLTVLHEPGQEDLARFLADHEVEIVASLPCYQQSNVERQRGRGAFDKSVRSLQLLNGLGYADSGSGLVLNLVYNPGGPSLPPAQEGLEAAYKHELSELYGVRFDRLLTITNMPIHRFAGALRRDDRLDAYMGLLTESFNPGTVPWLMCRTLLSVGWDGRLYDCDFNQMLDLPLPDDDAPRTIWELASVDRLTGGRVATADHCFGCTAGSGSSCRGALA